jgi:amino acid transporter
LGFQRRFLEGGSFLSKGRVSPTAFWAAETRRPTDLDWKCAAALLYAHWGTNKVFVLGLAFIAAGFSSLPILLAVCLLAAAVAYGYVIVCKYLPEGGDVYSAAREQSRFLGSVGALLLGAGYLAKAALNGWVAVIYLSVPYQIAPLTTMALMLAVGAINYFGPKNSGSLTICVAVPTVLVVILIILLSAPHLSFAHLEPLHEDFGHVWVSFVGLILALSGVEAVANLRGTLKPDSGSVFGRPKVGRPAFKAILPVAIEVSLGTALLGWAMLSLPREYAPEMFQRKEDMLRFLAEQYGTMNFGVAFGHIFGFAVGVVFALILLSAVNTAFVGLIGLLDVMARDGEMPRQFMRLNRHGVPWLPLATAVVVPITLVGIITNSQNYGVFESLVWVCAIGVVGAILINLASCAFNKNLTLKTYERVVLGVISLILFAVALTLAKTKPDALFFALCVLGAGLGLRAYSHKLSGWTTLTVTKDLADRVFAKENRSVMAPDQPSKTNPELWPDVAITTKSEGFLFVCYKREDMSRIKPILLSLCGWKCEVWYDKGIPGGAEWDAAVRRPVQDILNGFQHACGENGAAGWCEVDGLVHFGCGVVVWLLRKISPIWRIGAACLKW